MVNGCLLPTVISLVVSWCAPSDSDPHILVRKAFEAQCGMKDATRIRPFQFKMTGTANVKETAIKFTVDSIAVWPDRSRRETRVEVNGRSESYSYLLNGSESWITYPDR